MTLHPRTVADVFASFARANFRVDTLLEPPVQHETPSPFWSETMTPGARHPDRPRPQGQQLMDGSHEDRAAVDGVVLVHGGYHGAWCWDEVRSHLSSPSVAVDLPGRGDAPRPQPQGHPGRLRHRSARRCR